MKSNKKFNETAQTANFTQGRLPLPKQMNFRKSSKQPLTPPLIFGKLYCKFFKLATKPSKDGANRNINLGLKLGCTFLFSSGQGLNETRAQQLITQLNNKKHSRVICQTLIALNVRAHTAETERNVFLQDKGFQYSFNGSTSLKCLIGASCIFQNLATMWHHLYQFKI